MITENNIRRLVLFGTPMVLGVLMFMHTDDAFGQYTVKDADRWIIIHLLSIPFYGLLAGSVYLLLGDFTGSLPRVSRIAAWVFAVFFSAYEAMNGVAAGLFMRYTEKFETYAPPYEAIRFGVEDLSSETIVVVVGYLGGLGLLVALATLVVTLSRAGVSKIPLGLMMVPGIMLTLKHPYFYGLVGMALYLAGVWWVENGDWGIKKAKAGE